MWQTFEEQEGNEKGEREYGRWEAQYDVGGGRNGRQLPDCQIALLPNRPIAQLPYCPIAWSTTKMIWIAGKIIAKVEKGGRPKRKSITKSQGLDGPPQYLHKSSFHNYFLASLPNTHLFISVLPKRLALAAFRIYFHFHNLPFHPELAGDWEDSRHWICTKLNTAMRSNTVAAQ